MGRLYGVLFAVLAVVGTVISVPVLAVYNVSVSLFNDVRAFVVDMRRSVPMALVLARNQRGAYSIDSVWNVAFALIFLAILIPIGMSELNNADTTGWTATQVTVWGLIGTIIILVIAYAIYKGVSGGGGRRRGRGM